MAGVKQEEDSYLAIKKLYPKLLEFKKTGFTIPLSNYEGMHFVYDKISIIKK